MKNKNLQKDMRILTYLKILKFLKNNNIKEVRLLGGEPLLSPNIRKFLEIANKGGFDIIVFSNINIKNNKIIKIFGGLNGIRINCNINNEIFYSDEEVVNLGKNLTTLNKLGYKVIIGYNITGIKTKPDFIFNLAKKCNIFAINLKITNSSIGGKLLIDNKSRKLGIYIFEIIKKYHKVFFLEFSCGLDKNIFSKNELDYIKNKTKIQLKFGCNGNIGKFDIDTHGNFFKCFPLKNIFNNEKYSIFNLEYFLSKKIDINEIIKIVNNGLYCSGECTANKKIKEKL